MDSIENEQIEKQINERIEERIPKSKINISEANYIFAVAISLLFICSFVFGALIFSLTYLTKQGDENKLFFYFASPLIEIVAIFFPLLFYFIFKKVDFKKVLRLNKLSLKTVSVLILAGVAAQFGAGFLNNLSLFILQLLGKVPSDNFPQIATIQQLLYTIFIIGVIPAVFEEALFRGLILRGYQGFGWKLSIMITAVLFSISHFSLINFISLIFLGLIFGYAVYRTNSLFAGIILHLLNNTAAAVILFLNPIPNFQFYDKITNVDMLWSLLIGTAAILVLVGLLYLLNKTVNSAEDSSDINEIVEIKPFSEQRLLDYWPLILPVIFLLAAFGKFITEIVSNNY